MSSGETAQHSGRTKEAVIAAIATVLAAVIVASATVIASKQRHLAAAQSKAETLEDQNTTKTQQVKELQDQLAACRGETSKSDQETSRSARMPEGAITLEHPFPSKVLARELDNGFDVAFHGCRRISSNVRCYFTITNLKEERHFTLYGKTMNNPSRAVGDDGQERWPRIAELGGTEYYAPAASLSNGIPLRASLTFSDLPDTVQNFPIVQLFFGSEGYTGKVDFRNVHFDA